MVELPSLPVSAETGVGLTGVGGVATELTVGLETAFEHAADAASGGLNRAAEAVGGRGGDAGGDAGGEAAQAAIDLAVDLTTHVVEVGVVV